MHFTPRSRRHVVHNSFLLSMSLMILGVLRFVELQDRTISRHLTLIPKLYGVGNQIQQSNISQQVNSLSCLRHASKNITHGRMAGSVPNQTLLRHQTATTCGRLRRQWFSNPPRSEYAKVIAQHQSNCSLSLATHYMDNTFGLGSHLVLWGQAMCNGLETNRRMQSFTSSPWIWLDQDNCDISNTSPLHCYFPNAEPQCTDGDKDNNNNNQTMPPSINITDPRQRKDWCQQIQTATPELKAEIRASSTEYIFQQVSPLVIQEAQRQIGVVFGGGGFVPRDLVTVHIRWGDKFWEMDLPSIDEYINAVKRLLCKRNGREGNTTVSNANIYLATEDPQAYQEFLRAKPAGWKVFADITIQEIDAFRPLKGNRASWAARNTAGRSGLIALGSLLVAMEARMFVLTTKSNWSTLMNHLRTQIIDPQCGNCTDMIDLRPGVW
jgi:hypothetical protein